MVILTVVFFMTYLLTKKKKREIFNKRCLLRTCIQNYWAQQILLKSEVLGTYGVYKSKCIALKAENFIRKLFVKDKER